MRALELHEKHKEIAEELEDWSGVANACGNLGNCYRSMGQYDLKLLLEFKERAEKLGNSGLTMVANACGNLGNCHRSMGQYEQALLTQHHADFPKVVSLLKTVYPSGVHNENHGARVDEIHCPSGVASAEHLLPLCVLACSQANGQARMMRLSWDSIVSDPAHRLLDSPPGEGTSYVTVVHNQSVEQQCESEVTTDKWTKLAM